MTTWRFEPDFLLRATGFPIERLLSVAGPMATAPEPDGFVGPTRLQAERQALFAALGDALAREALLTSAPLVDQNFDGWRAHVDAGRRNSQDKKRERVLWRFLQRLTAKNDSTSFFGAVASGRFDLDDQGASDARTSILPIEVSRGVFATQWVVERLLASAIAELRAAGLHTAVPRRAPGVDAEGTRWAPGARGFAPSDEPTSVDLDVLPSGLVDPIGHAITALTGLAPSPPRDRWIGHLEALAAHRDAFARSAHDPAARRVALAELEAFLAPLLGEPATRHGGEFYASRGPVHEQADRTGAPVHVGSWGPALEAAIAPVLDLAFLQAAIDRVAFRAWFDRTFEATPPGTSPGPVPWREVLDALAEDPHGPDLAMPAAARRAKDTLRAFRATLRADIEREADPAAAVIIDPERFAPIREALASLAALGPLGRPYANPDFMIAWSPEHPERAPDFLLAEAHHLPHATACLLPPLADAAGIVARTTASLAALTAPDLPAFPVSYDHSFISVGPDLGAVGIELSGLAKEPPSRRATFVDLAVHLAADGSLRFTVPAHDGTLLAVAPLTRTARLALASPVFPLHLQDFGDLLAGPDWRSKTALPRLAIGPLVVHRRRYQLTASDLLHPDEPPLQALARRHGLPLAALPRFMFVRVASEPKPILLDWDSALATQLAHWSLARGETLELSEMLPGPDALWLRSPEGHHTAELRTVLTATS